MTGTRRSLLTFECRRVLRAPAVWTLLIGLPIVGICGAVSTARLHRDQMQDQVRMAAAEDAWYEDVRHRAARYARPASSALPYWQDPTDVAGFSRYFLRRVATKPHLPLSPLAVGHSDLQPFAVPVKLESLFGGDPVYDYEPPRALATGRFDLSFVLVFILPLWLGGVAASVGATERDQDILSLVAAQPLNPRRWWSLRLGALAIVLVPAVAVAVLASLTAAGAPGIDAWRETVTAVCLVAASTMLWLAIAGWCLMRGQGAVGTVSSVTAIWLVLTVGAPLLGSLVIHSAASVPSPIADVNELRRVSDDIQAQGSGIVKRRLVEMFGPGARTVNPADLDYSTRLVLLTQEKEFRLANQEVRRQAHRARAAQVADLVWWASPQVALGTALADLAGTGTARHTVFLDAVRQFQLDLRGFMYPRVLAQATRPGPRLCADCQGRLTFTEYDDIPRFAMAEVPSMARARTAMVTAAWLVGVTMAIIGVGVARTTDWVLA